MTSGIPRANSRTLFLTQSAAFSLDTSAFSRAVKQADGDNHVRSAIEQIIGPETFQLAHQRHKAVLNALRPFRS